MPSSRMSFVLAAMTAQKHCIHPDETRVLQTSASTMARRSAPIVRGGSNKVLPTDTSPSAPRCSTGRSLHRRRGLRRGFRRLPRRRDFKGEKKNAITPRPCLPALGGGTGPRRALRLARRSSSPPVGSRRRSSAVGATPEGVPGPGGWNAWEGGRRTSVAEAPVALVDCLRCHALLRGKTRGALWVRAPMLHLAVLAFRLPAACATRNPAGVSLASAHRHLRRRR
mmetsp:Transcript_60394/g.168754  ORF Transcript_60394/g.168754 Transcript_60394/m.168754 type:complete len:225 (-) Transcript_60394:403-1077(-)